MTPDARRCLGCSYEHNNHNNVILWHIVVLRPRQNAAAGLGQTVGLGVAGACQVRTLLVASMAGAPSSFLLLCGNSV